MAFSAVPVHCYGLALLLLGLASGCAPSAVTLNSGVVHVSFTTEETCGFSNPYTVEARGCRRLDEKAVMCKGFGVIDGVLFAGGCEAPADLEVLETQGTMPLSPPRDEPPADDGAPPTEPSAEAGTSEPAELSEEPAPKPEKKARAASKKSKTKKSRRKKRP